MSENLQDEIAAAEAYEALHVSALFEEWTEPVLDAAEVEPGHRVLDVACGTGVLARAALSRVGPTGAVVGLDPAPGMLAVAGRIAPSVDWQLGTAEALPFPDASFDRVVSQFGLMFFVDRAGAAFNLGDPGALTDLFESAGLESPEITSHTGTGRFPNIRTMVEADLRGWLPIMGVDLTEDQIESVLAEAENVLARFVETSGDVVFDSPAHIVACRT